MTTAAERRSETGIFGMAILSVLAIVLAIAIVGTGKYAIAGLVGLFFFVFFVMYPVVGVYATTAMLLLQGSSGILGTVNPDAPVAITLAQLVGLAALGAWFANLLLMKARIEFNWPIALISLFTVWALFSTLISPYAESGFPHWARLAARLGLFLLAVNTLNTRRNITYFVLTILFCSALMAAIAVVQYVMPSLQFAGAEAWAGMNKVDGAFIDQESLQGESAIRVSGRAGHSNWLAMILLVVLPLNGFWWALCTTKKQRLLVLGATAFEVLALILTFTRSGFVIGVVVAALYYFRGHFRVSPLRIFVALFALVIAFTMLPDAYKRRVLSPTSYSSKNSISINSRLDLQGAALRYSTQNPVAGLGVGGFGEEFVRENSWTAQQMKYMVQKQGWRAIFIGTHNMYLQLSADTGFIGLFLYVGFFIAIVHRLFATLRYYKFEGDDLGSNLTSVTLIAVIGFLVCALFLHALHQDIWWMLVALAVAITQHRIDFRGPLPQWSWSFEARAR